MSTFSFQTPKGVEATVPNQCAESIGDSEIMHVETGNPFDLPDKTVQADISEDHFSWRCQTGLLKVPLSMIDSVSVRRGEFMGNNFFTLDLLFHTRGQEKLGVSLINAHERERSWIVDIGEKLQKIAPFKVVLEV